VRFTKIFCNRTPIPATYSIMVVCSLACVGLSGYAAYQFYWAVDTKELMAWSVAFIIGILAVSIMKIWAWLEM